MSLGWQLNQAQGNGMCCLLSVSSSILQLFALAYKQHEFPSHEANLTSMEVKGKISKFRTCSKVTEITLVWWDPQTHISSLF